MTKCEHLTRSQMGLKMITRQTGVQTLHVKRERNGMRIACVDEYKPSHNVGRTDQTHLDLPAPFVAARIPSRRLSKQSPTHSSATASTDMSRAAPFWLPARRSTR